MAIPDESKRSPKDETTATRAVASVIAEHPFFAGLKPVHLDVLADHAMRMAYQPGEFIFQENSPANRFYLIERGKVFPVCGNTWRMLADTRFAPHFDSVGNFATHYGIFPGCGTSIPFATNSAPASKSSGGCC